MIKPRRNNINNNYKSKNKDESLIDLALFILRKNTGVRAIKRSEGLNNDNSSKPKEFILPLYFGWEIVFRRIKDLKKHIVGPFKKYWQYMASVIVLIMVVSTALFFHDSGTTLAQTFSFIQTDWSGGVSATEAEHATDQSGWTYYSSASSTLNLNVAGEISLASTSGVTTHDTDSDFGLGVNSSTTVAYTGTSAQVELSQTQLFTNFAAKLQDDYNTPGSSYGVAASGTYAYIADRSSGLRVIDISSSTNLSEVDFYSASTDSTSVEISGNYAYVGDRANGLRIFNISSSTDISLAGTYDSPGDAQYLEVVGNYVYLGDSASGFRVVDVSSSTNPVSVASNSTPSNNYDVAVSGNYAYLAMNTSGLRILDISSSTNLVFQDDYDTPGQAFGVFVAGNYAYVADGASGLQIIDISSSTDPVFEGVYNTPGTAYKVEVVGNYAYVADGTSGIQVIDISSSSNPQLAFEYDTTGEARDIDIIGDYAYVADNADGLKVIDISIPVYPELSGGQDTDGNAYDVGVSGDYAYVADGLFGLQVIDKSSTSNMSIIDTYDTTGTALGVTLFGSIAYVADGTSGLQVLDITIPSSVSFLGVSDTTGTAEEVAISGNYAYVADGTSGLEIVDISSSTNPFSVYTLDTPGNARGIVVSGDYAYIADDSFGLQVIDISSTTNPSIVETVDTTGTARNIDVSGNYAYIADDVSGLQIIDISSSTNASVVATYNTAGNTYDVKISEGYAYLADRANGLEIVDVSSSTNPRLANAYNTAGSADGAFLSGNHVYIADYTSGLALVGIKSYISDGVFTSSIIDTSGIQNFTTLTHTSTAPSGTTLTIDARAGNTATPDGSWTSWDADIASGDSISSFSGNRYIQYRGVFTSSDIARSPSIDTVTFNYESYQASGTLVSSIYDTGDLANVIANLNARGSLGAASTTIAMQLRTSPTGTSSWTNWCGSTLCNDTDTFDFTSINPSSGQTITLPGGHVLKDGASDRYFQYRIILTGGPLYAPTFESLTLTYVVNVAPEIQNVSIGSGQASDGTITIDYEIRDTDTDNGITPGIAVVDLQYCTANCSSAGSETWATATAVTGDTGSTTVASSSWTAYQIVWTPRTDYNGIYNATDFKMRLRANDSEAANNYAYAETATTTLDTKVPVEAATPVSIQATSTPARLIFSVTDDSSLEYRASLNSDFSGASWSSYVASTTISLAADPDTVYVQFRDVFGNTNASSSITSIETPDNLIVQDLSNTNLQTPEYSLFIAWQTVTEPSAGFNEYRVVRSLDNITFTPLTTIADRTINYYWNTGLTVDTDYYYKVALVDDDNNISYFSTTLHGSADGTQNAGEGGGGSGSVAPVLSNVATSSVYSTEATIVWDTDTISDSVIGYSTSPATFTSFATSTAMKNTAAGIGQHSVVLYDLTPNTTYYFQAYSNDPVGNIGSDSDGGNGYTFTTLDGPIISTTNVVNVDNASATISWTTNAFASSVVVYSVSPGLDSPSQVSDASLVANHSVNLTGLSQGTTYYFKVQSQDAQGDMDIDSNNGIYYNFTTTIDTTAPTTTSGPSNEIIGDTYATVDFTTDEGASSQVQYGTATSTYTGSAIGSYTNYSHSVQLSGLTQSTTYYYRVIITDSNGNVSTTTESNFTTLETLSEESEVVAREAAAAATATASSSAAIAAAEAAQAAAEAAQADAEAEAIAAQAAAAAAQAAAAAAQNANAGGGGGVLFVDNSDKIKPIISDISVSDIRSDRAVINWKTNEVADSFVEYGPTTAYGDIYGISRADSTDHSVLLKWLDPEQVYNFRVTSEDAGANLTVSANQTFTTLSVAEEIEQKFEDELSFEDVEDLTDPQDVDELYTIATNAINDALELFKQVSGKVSLSQVEESLILQNKTIQDIAGILPAPFLSGEPRVVTTARTATIAWQTNKDSNSLVDIASADDYAPNTDSPYLQTLGNRDDATDRHVVTIYDLEPDTIYHYEVKSQAKIGPIAKSGDFTFKTQREELEINNFAVEVLSNEAAVFKWITNVPADTKLRYTPYRDNTLAIDSERQKENEVLTNIHEVKVDDFEAGVIYKIEFISTDAEGIVATKEIGAFSTTEDDIAPEIFNVKTSSALSSGTNTTVQTIISWRTNELATTKVYFGEGLIKDGSSLLQETKLDDNYSKQHTAVITKFEPGKIYTFKVESVDSGGNITTSKNFTLLTPRQKESVFQVIMKNIEEIFGWVGGIGG